MFLFEGQMKKPFKINHICLIWDQTYANRSVLSQVAVIFSAN